MSGWLGAPSKIATVQPRVSAMTWQFHMIQPEAVSHMNVSPARMSLWSGNLEPSSRIPPWPCTMGFGVPVVPEE